jgi:hypothetical protein
MAQIMIQILKLFILTSGRDNDGKRTQVKVVCNSNSRVNVDLPANPVPDTGDDVTTAETPEADAGTISNSASDDLEDKPMNMSKKIQWSVICIRTNRVASTYMSL